MPEFAEVNAQVKWLRERVLGWTPTKYEVRRNGHFPAIVKDRDATLEAFFVGATLEGVTQHGKHVVMRFNTGTSMSHLMFSGRWSIAGDDFISNYKHHVDKPLPSVVTFALTCSQGVLNFHEPDNKGKVHAFPGKKPAEVDELAALGPDVLITPETDPDFKEAWTLEAFTKAITKARTAIKPFLLDQKKQAGIGNMYACESLYRARVAPTRTGNTLSPAEVEAVFQGVQGVIQESIDTKLDYARVLAVYRREKDPDGNAVVCDAVGGRDTFWVPDLQK